MFSDEQIYFVSATEAVYGRGVQLYYRQAVQKVNMMREGDDYTARAYVKGSKGTPYYCTIEWAASDPWAVWATCTCAAANVYEGACKHVVALMTQVAEAEKKGNLAVERMDAVFGEALLDHYEQAVMRSIESYKKHYIGVEPKLYLLEEGGFGIGLSVGENRMYVVRSVEAFVENILQEEQDTYGKGLAFVHHIDAFTEETLPLVKLVIEQVVARVGDFSPLLTSRKKDTGSKKRFPFTPGGFDKFFDLYRGHEIAYQDEYETNTVKLVDGDPEITLFIERNNAHFQLYAKQKNYVLVDFPMHQYVWIENQIYRVSRAFKQRVWPVLTFMQQVHPPKLQFDEIGFKRFSQTILRRLKNHVTLTIEEELLKTYAPPNLTIGFYLDKDSTNQVVGKVVYDYDGVKINPFGVDSKIAVPRDIEKEHSFQILLEEYGFSAQKGEIHLVQSDAIYRLLTEGIQEFLHVAEVHVTDQLRDLKLRKPVVGQIGLKVRSSLLEVEVKDLAISPAQIQEVLQAYRQKKKYYRLKDGVFIDLLGEELALLDELVTTTEAEETDFERGMLEVGKYRTMYLEGVLNRTQSVVVTKDKEVKSFTKRMRHAKEEEEELPATLEPILRSYQKEGYNWLYTMASYGFGGILADDMGLGKTLQVIAMLLRAKEVGDEGTSIVVAPTSLVLNWQKEIEKFAPKLNVVVMNGLSTDRKSRLESQEVAEADVLITSYELLKRDIDSYALKTFLYCIADEAQYIKNPTTQNAKAIKRMNAKVRFALTGTPIENALSELWSIFDFCMPGYLFTYQQFKASYETPIVRMEDEAILKRLQQMVAPFILRRLKKDVLKELPPKTETILYNSMEEEQRTLYEAHLALVQEELSEELEQNGFSRSQIKILSMLTRMRQLCCHPGLYLEDYNGGSSKLSQCMEVVTECVAGGHKVLIFSQFTSMLERIGHELAKEQIDCYSLTGQTKPSKRMEMVEQFNQDNVPVFLISLKAGGTGLNLTGADVVIHYDPWWNVSSEQQATDRVYRIGQENPVQVFKLITQDSVEEKIRQLQDKKIALADNLLTEGGNLISQMTEEEIKALFY